MTPMHEEGSTSTARYDDNPATHNHNEDHQNGRPTPLPFFPLLSMYLIQLAEPITAAVIYPFVNQFVRETGITGGDEKKTGYYAGVIESAFFFAECLTVVQWGYLSDRYGRRPVLLCAPIGLAFAMLFFGMSTTFWALVGARCLQGAFNGNVGVTKSAIAELTDSSNRGDAFAYMTMVWSIGLTVGPILGGVLANPEVQWPNSFGRIPYLRIHPYFLPCFVAGLYAFGAFIFVCFALKETLPSLVEKEKALKKRKNPCDDVPSANTTLISHGDDRNYGTGGVEDTAITTHNFSDPSEMPTLTPADAHFPPEVSIRAVLIQPILVTLGNYACLTFLDMSYVTLLPLVYSTPITYGGLGMNPFEIGFILGVFGFVNSFIQAKVLGGLIRKYGARKLYRRSFAFLFACLAMYPIMHFFAQKAGRVNFLVRACIFLQFGFQVMIYIAYGSMQVLIVESVPKGGPMGTVNGLAQMLSSGTRTFAPSFASSLFALSLQRRLAGGNMVYYVLIAITLIGVRCSGLLPKNEKIKVGSGKPGTSLSEPPSPVPPSDDIGTR